MRNNKKIKLFFLVLFFLFLTPAFVFALEINYPRVPGATPPQDFINTVPSEQILSLYVLYIFNLIIWISGIIAFGAIVYAGIRYLTSAGSPEAMFSARKQISDALLGILILLSSFIILRVINPQLITLEVPETEPVEIVERPETSAPPTGSYLSSIDVEIPFGRIIEERIFESYVPPGETKKPRMTRIKENAKTSLEITNKLVEINNELKEELKKCKCYDNTVPNPRCGGECVSCPPDECTCDPCENVRGDIKSSEEDNLNQIDKLKEEQKKTTEEIRLLSEELAKLERIESYLTQDCRLWTIQSLKEFLLKVDQFKENGELRQIRSWNDIDTIYYNQKEEGEVRDWATFYCPVGGTMFLKQPTTPSLRTPEPGVPEEYTQVVNSCPQEVPIGEIIDRAKRTAGLLIQTLEKLVSAQEEMISAVDEMQVLVSQCSSKRCFPVCFCYKKNCIEIGCFGLPCPYWEIEYQAKKIEEIRKKIEKLVNGGEEEGIEKMPFWGDVKDLALFQKRNIYTVCEGEYKKIVEVIKEGWTNYCSDKTDCVWSSFDTTECKWKGSPDGLKNAVENYVRLKIGEDVLRNWNGYYCNLLEKKLALERINKFINCVNSSSCDGYSCSSSCTNCYDSLEESYMYYDLRPCVGACVQEEIKKELKNLMPGPTSQKSEGETGIIPIIDKKVPKILEDLEKEIRLPMRECIIKGADKVLFDCQRLIGALDPKGDVIRACCNKEPVFNECLNECYLEEGQERYKKCLTDCLNKEAEATGLQDISWCRHQLNFFCCNVTKEPLQ